MRSASLLFVLVLACGDDDSPTDASTDVPTIDAPSAARILASEGGTIASPDGRFTLEIPPGALASDTDMAVLEATSSIDAIGDVYDVEPDGTAFSIPATATIRLSLLQVTDVISSEGAYPALFVGTSEDGTAVEELEGSEVTYAADGTATITAPVEHLSLFWAGGQRAPYGVNLGLEVSASQTLGAFEGNVVAENRSGVTQYIRFRTSSTGAVSAAGGGTAPTTGSTPIGTGGGSVSGTLAFNCDEEGMGEIRIHLGYGTLESSPETSGITLVENIVCRTGTDGGMSTRPTTCTPPLSADMELNDALQAYAAELAFEPDVVCDLDTPSGWRDDPGPSAGKLVFRSYTAASPFGEDRHLFVPTGAVRLEVVAISAGTPSGPGTWVGLPNGSDFTIDVRTESAAMARVTARFDGTMLTVSSVTPI